MLANTNIRKRNNIQVLGKGNKTIVLAHGFGCDQTMWRFLTPLLQDDFRIILFDYVGCGQSDYSAFDRKRYSSLHGYAKDVVDVCMELELKNTVFVGHSVSSIIGMYAAIEEPNLFSQLVMVCPSPCFLNLPPDYMGGFEKEDLEELINLMDKNYIGWANYLAPLVMGQNNDTSYIEELEQSFCSTDPKFAKPFAKATFFSDDRAALTQLQKNCLILQSHDDNLASIEVGEYMHQRLVNSTLIILDAHGHCLHMTQPKEVYDAIIRFIE